MTVWTMHGHLHKLANLNETSQIINYTVIKELEQLVHLLMLNGRPVSTEQNMSISCFLSFCVLFTQCRHWTFKPSQHVAGKTGKSNATVPKGMGLEKKVALWSERGLVSETREGWQR